MAEQYLKCPNCGANATNHQNCEYCGSLLVRFVEKGIDLSKTTYLSNDAVFPELVEELKHNLLLQEQNPYSDVDTTIGEETEDGVAIIAFIQNPSGSSTPELRILFYFPEGDELLEIFKSLDCYRLFKYHSEQEPDSKRIHFYEMNFGKDAEGAARLISDILINVFNMPLSKQLDLETNVTDRQISTSTNHEDSIDDEGGIPSWVYWAGAALLLGLAKCAF